MKEIIDMPQNFYEIMSRRGFVEWCSHPEELGRKMLSESITGYVGFDPSADSLHVGNMVPIMGLAWLQKLGHKPIGRCHTKTIFWIPS